MEIGTKVTVWWRGAEENGTVVGRKGKSDFYRVQLWTGEYCWRYSAELERR